MPPSNKTAQADPQPGDIYYKWGQSFLVTQVTMGCVFTWPSLSAHRDWVGICYFRDWATDADKYLPTEVTNVNN